ncbi:MAG: hypothetical protein E6J32_09080, partial [Chloroflexi bacterium]
MGMNAAGVHQHETEQRQPGEDDHDQESFDRQPMPGEKPAHHRPHIRKDADRQDAGEVEMGRTDETAADVDRRRRDEGDRGHPKHGLVEGDRNPLGFSHDAPKYNGYSAGFQRAGAAAVPGSGRCDGSRYRPTMTAMARGPGPNGQAVEPPLRVQSREELVYLLGEACELEHGLLCEYLYAQFSLKRGVAEGVTLDQLARIQAWETTLIDVIKQEMLHLALATNILTSVGAAPHFERPNFPIRSRWYPPDVQIALEPFGERALRHFMYLERPEGMPLEDAEGFAALGQMQPLTADDPQLTAGPEEWHTVGHLYRGIEAGLAHLVDRYGDAAVFIGPPKAQATTEVFEWPQLTAVTDLASASRAIEVIVEQGEGARGDWINSHFGKFVGILEDYLAVRAVDPSFEPARPVLPVFLRPPPDVDEPVLIADPLTRRVADLFNAVYEIILQLQSRYFVHHGE